MEYTTDDNQITVRLDQGDQVIEKFRQLADMQDITAGTVLGVGALEDFTLGYFRRQDGEYSKQTFDQPHELTNLTGFISRQNGQSHIHAHATLAGPDQQAIGGHLHAGRIAAAGEFRIILQDTRVERIRDNDLNLDLMSFTDG